jgi:hypothetical protein
MAGRTDGTSCHIDFPNDKSRRDLAGHGGVWLDKAGPGEAGQGKAYRGKDFQLAVGEAANFWRER